MALTKSKLSLRERNKLRLRAELLDAVLDLFLHDDPNALSVEAVARVAGCSKATVYVYFPGGMNEMLCAVYESISSEVNAEAKSLHAAANSPHDRIMGLAQALLKMAARPRSGKFFAQLNPTLSPALEPVLGISSAQYEAMLSNDLAEIFDTETPAISALLVGALREASVKIAKDPSRVAEFTNGFSTLVAGLISQATDTTHNESKT